MQLFLLVKRQFLLFSLISLIILSDKYTQKKYKKLNYLKGRVTKESDLFRLSIYLYFNINIPIIFLLDRKRRN